MNENLVKLLQMIADSDELQAQFGNLATLDEAYELASKLQQGFTKEEFLDAVKALNEAADEDISDEELAATAGGIDDVIDPIKITDDKKTLSCVTKSNTATLTRSIKPTSIRTTR